MRNDQPAVIMIIIIEQGHRNQTKPKARNHETFSVCQGVLQSPHKT